MARERTNQTWWIGVNSLFSAVILLCLGLVLAGCGSDTLDKGKKTPAADRDSGQTTPSDGGVLDSGSSDMGIDPNLADAASGDGGVFDGGDPGPDASSQVDMSEPDAGNDLPCLEYSDVEVDFGPATVGEVTRRLVTLRNCSRAASLSVTSVRIEDDSSNVFSIDFGALAGPSFELAAQEFVSLSILFEPGSEVAYSGTLVVETDDPARGRVDIQLDGTGTAVPCPVAVATATSGGSSGANLTIEPLFTVNLDGSASTSSTGPIDEWEWVIMSRPSGSRARFSPAGDIVDPGVYLDLVGTYVFELRVYSGGVQSCSGPSTVTIEVLPTEDVYIQLFWDAPGAPTPPPEGSGVDLDLHYLREHPDAQWSQAPWTVFWEERSASWGGSQAQLTNDSANGLSPEVTIHESPEQGVVHRVGVHYYAYMSGQSQSAPAAYATVAVYLSGIKSFEDRDVLISSVGQFWEVAEFAGGSSTVTKLGGITTGIP